MSLRVTLILIGAACLVIGPAARALAEPVSCSAVDTLAELYTRADAFISIDVAGDSNEKVCYFSIDGATKDTAENATKKIDQGISYLSEMKAAFRSGKTKEQLSVTAGKFADYLPYVLASARLEDGEPPTEVFKILAANSKTVGDCFSEFYSGAVVKLAGENLGCETLGLAANTLYVGIGYETRSYSLYTFR